MQTLFYKPIPAISFIIHGYFGKIIKIFLQELDPQVAPEVI